MPPRQPRSQRHQHVSPFAKVHPHIRALLASVYNTIWPWIFAALAHNTLLYKTSHARKTLVLSLALAVWLAKPTLVIAEVVYGLRAVVADNEMEVGEQENEE